jgi:hypothetical protein
MPNQNKILIVFLTFSVMLITAVFRENVKAVLRSNESQKIQETTLAPSGPRANVERIKEEIYKAEVVSHPAMYWKNN